MFSQVQGFQDLHEGHEEWKGQGTKAAPTRWCVSSGPSAPGRASATGFAGGGPSGSRKEFMPVRYLPAQIKREPANAEIGESIRDDYRDSDPGINLPGPQGRTDTRVASTYNDRMTH